MLALLGGRKALAGMLWPSRPVHVVVPFSPGTGMDTLARSLAPHLSALCGQTIVIDNRPGASGNLGANAVTKSLPDGHMLMVGVKPGRPRPSAAGRAPMSSWRDERRTLELHVAHVGLAADDCARRGFARGNRIERHVIYLRTESHRIGRHQPVAEVVPEPGALRGIASGDLVHDEVIAETNSLLRVADGPAAYVPG